MNAMIAWLFRKGVDLYWNSLLLTLAQKRAAPAWDRCFQVTAKQAGVSPAIAAHLSSSPGLLRFLHNTFKPDRPVASASDFAVAIAFELSRWNGDRPSDVSWSPSAIRAFAACVRRAWLHAVTSSIFLRMMYKDARGSDPSDAISRDALCTSELDKTITGRVRLFRAYFGRYAAPDATEKITIWCPRDDHTIEFFRDSVRNSAPTVVHVPINTVHGADTGFFRKGFDYSIDGTERKWLCIAFPDEKSMMEIGRFGGFGDLSVVRALPAHKILWFK